MMSGRKAVGWALGQGGEGLHGARWAVQSQYSLSLVSHARRRREARALLA